MAFYQLEPWGEKIIDRHMSNLSAIQASANSKEKKYKPDDFLLHDKEDKRPIDADKLVEKVAALNAMIGGEDNR